MGELLNTGQLSCVSQLMKYIRRGEGEYEPVSTDRVLGLIKVKVSWFRTGTMNESNLKEYDNTGDDRTSTNLVVILTHENGQEDRLQFELDFSGYC